MRHNRRSRKLGRTHSERKALFENLVTSLLKYQAIKTTLPKAKEAQRLAEHVIHLSKTDTVAARRQVFSYLQDRTLTSQLFKNVAPRYKTRIGGYTRILRLDRRKGDGAQLAILELTEKEIKIKATPKAKAKKQQPATGHEGHDHEHKAQDKTGTAKTQDHTKDLQSPSQDPSKQKGLLKNIGKFFRNKGGS